MSPKPFVLALLLLISLVSTHATRYKIIDDSTIGPGEKEYASHLSHAYDILFDATDEVLNTFNQKEGEGKKYDTVILSIESFAQSPHADAVAITKDNVILLNADYPKSFQGDIKEEYAGVVYHEMTHVWQWTGNGMAPEWLIEGIADFLRLRGGYASKDWPRRGSGSSWKDGYAVTAYFIEYCNGLKRGFVAELNALMKHSYSDAFFVQLLGKSVHELWLDYKLAYGTTRIPGSDEGHRKDIAESILGWLAELTDMLEKNHVPIPSINSRKLDPNWQRTADRTSRSQIDKTVIDWQA